MNALSRVVLAALCSTVMVIAHNDAHAQRGGRTGLSHMPLAGTPPPTPAPEVPVSFKVYNVDLQSSRQPEWDPQVAHITRVKVGQTVALAIYVRASQLPQTFALEYLWGVRVGSRQVAHHGTQTIGYRNLQNLYWTYWLHAFGTPGTFRFTGAADVNGTRRYRSVTFTVYR